MVQNAMPQRKFEYGQANGNGNGKPPAAFEGRALLDGPFFRKIFVSGKRLEHTEMGSAYFKECWREASSLAEVNGEMVLVAVSRKEIGSSALWRAELRFLENDLEEGGLLVTSAAHERIEGRQFYVLVPKEKAAELARTSLPEPERSRR